MPAATGVPRLLASRGHAAPPPQRTVSRPAASRRPLLVAMAGLPGTGKSTCANLIARQLQLPVIDKDDVLELVRTSTVRDELEQGRLTYDVLFSLASRQLENGVSVVVDTCLAYRWLRSKFANVATDCGARMLVVHCECDDEMARARIAARVTHGLPHRNLSEYDRLRRLFEPFDARPHLTIDTSGNMTAIAAQVAAALAMRPFQALHATVTT